ncbi:MAG: carboxypeptidase-like regulatory domain-containing protein [Candidatus Micrarchaeota archaeon]
MKNLYVFLMLALALSCAENLYTVLSFHALDQDYFPLEDVEFFLECNNTPDFNAFAGKKYICTSDETGSCSPDACFGCEGGITAVVYARLAGVEKEAEVAGWTGRERVCGYGAIRGCCEWGSFGPKQPPETEIPVFIFDAGQAVFSATDEKEEAVAGVDVAITSPGSGFSRNCTTNSEGRCAVVGIPEGARITYAANYSTAELRGGSLEFNGSTVVPLVFDLSGAGAGEIDAAFVLVEKRRDVPYEIELPEIGKRLLEGERIWLENRTYEVNVLGFGKPAYNTIVVAQENITLNLSSLFCVADCSVCGCAGEKMCSFSPLHGNYGCCLLGENWDGRRCGIQSSMRVFIVPINYDPVSMHKEMYGGILGSVKYIDRQLGLGYASYYMINESFEAGPEYCDGKYLRLDLLEEHFLSWYKKTRVYDKTLEPWKERYRLVGIDFGDACDAGTMCGFTYRRTLLGDLGGDGISPVYVRYDERCNGVHISAHELGHTFGLCDDYNPYVWESQNAALFSPCPNPKPTLENTLGECTASCEPEGACCYGIVNPDGTYSTMGSANTFDSIRNVSIVRAFNRESLDWILKKLEGVDAR